MPANVEQWLRDLGFGKNAVPAESCRVIGRGALLFLGIAVLSLIPPLTVHLDIAVFDNGLTEVSFTEFGQTLVLLTVTALYARVAWLDEDKRGFFVLASGFFACMLIRELDVYFDRIRHGAWLYPALVVALGTGGYALLKCRDSIVKPWAAFVRSSSFFPAVIGLVVLLVFSRVFGSGNLIWKPVMGEDYTHLYKTVVQEGLELLGYLLLLLSAVRLRGNA